ncbi:MAG: hypothetical protein N4A71_23655 [Carboxylicivirga sp.]|jgi:predicted ThiF/HesA family dinucleotide-utilizing enzyme|nr:hypothetical protein [Carboxylicivirga sp.]
MTGGLGFVRDGINAQKRNRRMVKDLKDKHFKPSKPKSDFSRKYAKSKHADAEVIKTIREQSAKDNQRNLIKNIILIVIAIGIAIASYFFLMLID